MINKYEKVSGPMQVSFDVTSGCNLKCVHCFNDSGSSAPLKDLTKEEKLRIADQIADFRPVNVCLCGGESTCCPYLLDIIDILKPRVGKVSMVTNGMLMTPELATALKEHGLNMAQISIDGAYAWQHDSFRGVQGSFEHAVNAVKYLIDAGVTHIDTSLVPNRLNFRSMEEYAQMCVDLGVTQIRMMPFLPSGRGVGASEKLMLNEEEYYYFGRTLKRLENEYSGRIEFQWGDPLDHMRRMPVNASLGMKSYMMEIKTNGDLTFTSYLPVSAGNCADHSLREYWDAGYDRIWGDERFTKYSGQIRNIYDLEDFEPKPYTGETIVIDLLKEETDEIHN